MSRILLDTNALIWLLTGDEGLGAASRKTLTAAGPVRFSSVSILELTIKSMLGKLSLPADPATAASAAGLHELTFTAAHASALAQLPDLVRHDPFDRMLLAQAMVEGLQLLTADRVLLDLGLPWTVDARR